MPKPKIDRQVFDKISTFGGFTAFVEEYYIYLTEGTGIRLTFDAQRFASAYEFWRDDIDALPRKMQSGEPDHFKKSGFLAFWLRREPPVMCWDDSTVDLDQLSPQVQYQLTYLKKYGREYGAFMLGYTICLHFECSKSGGPYIPSKFGLTSKYIDDIMFFMKRMNVSPHGLYLIYESLFLRANEKLGF